MHAIQARYKLTPLCYWGMPEDQIPYSRDVYKPSLSLVGSEDPLGAWKTLNAMLAENPRRCTMPFCSNSLPKSASAPG